MNNETAKEPCECGRSWCVCIAIAETKRLAEELEEKVAREDSERTESVRSETIAQAKVLKNIFPAVSDFCDNVIALLEGEDL